jgi:hypothetical protein
LLIPESERQTISKEISALRTYIAEAYTIDKEKDRIGPAWLEKTAENYYRGKSLSPKVRKSRKKCFDELFFPQIMDALPEKRGFLERSENYLHGLFKLIKAFFSWCIKSG